MKPEYKVFEVDNEQGKRWEIFYCPSAPVLYSDRVAYDGTLYTHRQAAYRHCKKLNDRLAKQEVSKI